MNKKARPRRDFLRRKIVHSAIEPLESRIAPATLVSPTTVTYQDKNGDTVTVSLSKPLFTQALVNKVFTFDTGSVNGDNSTQQQLESLTLAWFGHAITGANVSITVPQTSNGPVNVGYINSSGLNLGNVTVDGDLGRIAVGGPHYATPALVSLTVDSIGALGLTTQAAAHASLNTLVNGSVGTITVNGDIDNANIGIGGGVHGVLGSLVVTGSINGDFNGSTANFAGSVNVQGGIASIQISGSLVGGTGNSSGTIGTTGTIGSVNIGGDIDGGAGAFSGALLSTHAMGSATGTIQIGGSIVGGAGLDSGQIGTASNLLAPVTIEGAIEGGAGKLSGVILAAGNITSVTIADGLIGGSGVSSGQIGAGKNIGSIFLGTGYVNYGLAKLEIKATGPSESFDGVLAGSGAFSGSIAAGGNIGSIITGGTIEGPGSVGPTPNVRTHAENSSSITPAIFVGGTLQTLEVGGILDAGITVNGSIGTITAYDSITDSVISANLGIGSILVGSGGVPTGSSLQFQAVVLASSALIESSSFVAAHGSIGPITISGDSGEGIDGSTFIASGSIGDITVTTLLLESTGIALFGSQFYAGGNIGNLNLEGSIYSSTFVAGANITSALSGITPAFLSQGVSNFTPNSGLHTPSHIGNITLSGASDAIGSTTFLAGYVGPGADKIVNTADDNVVPHSTIGSFTAAGGMSSDTVESGTIGSITSGALSNDTVVATDTSPVAGGIGAITVTASQAGFPVNDPVATPLEIIIIEPVIPLIGISGSSFISNTTIGDISVTLSGSLTEGTSSGIDSSTFTAGHAIGTITVSNTMVTETSGTFNYAISNSTFKAGLFGVGGIGDIQCVLGDSTLATTTVITNSSFDASVHSTGSFGGIYADDPGFGVGSGAGVSGIVDSTFRAHGNIGAITAIVDDFDITAIAITGSVFSAFGSIGNISAVGSVTADTHGPSRILAGYDIGADLTFGNEDLSIHSTMLQGGQSIGNVNVTGYFSGSDIAASVNPGSAYTFGDSTGSGSSIDNTNIGIGGFIGIVELGTDVNLGSSPFVSDHATFHAIEAANFALSKTVVPQLGAFGYAADIPVVVYVDGGTGDVRITNLTYPDQG
jgi:hypothetical protein